MSPCFSLTRSPNLSRSQPDSRLPSFTFPRMTQFLHPLYEHAQPIISLTKGSRSSETIDLLSLHGENLTLISTCVIPSFCVSLPQQREATVSLETSVSISFLKTSCNVFNVNEKYNNPVSCFLIAACVFFVKLLIAPKHAGAVTRLTQRMQYYNSFPCTVHSFIAVFE